MKTTKLRQRKKLLGDSVLLLTGPTTSDGAFSDLPFSRRIEEKLALQNRF